MNAGASSIADNVDLLFWSMVLLCGSVALGVFVAIWYFAIRYRRGSRAPRPQTQERELGIEVLWTVIPLALFIGIYIWSIRLYARIETPPADAMPIYVVARQWMWKAQHVGGQREINALHVPEGKAVKLIMSSEDVIHSFGVPAFRIKQDVLPDRTTELWFTATRVGEYPLYCMEFCGAEHSRMGGKIIVQTPADFAAWLAATAPAQSLAARGAALYRSYGCSGCHENGSSVHAPPLQGLYGRPVMLADGSRATADDAYFRDSILLPQQQIATGYPAVMPSFAGQIGAEDLAALSAWFQSVAADNRQATSPP
jgi:cytochrome c oxidase subunit 2